MDRGVFYPQNSPGETWNGLTSVTESPSDADEQTRYRDGVKTQLLRRLEDFSGTIQAYTYPDSFYEDVLMQRRRTYFGLSYRVQSDDGYKIHLIYNVKISPGSISHQQFEIELFEWDFTTKPVPVPGARFSAHLIIDTAKAYSWTMAAIEDVLYGSESEAARLPTPEELLEIFEINSILRIIDHGDGSFTAIGPDDVVQMLDSTTFQISWPSAIFIDADSYTLSSL